MGNKKSKQTEKETKALPKDTKALHTENQPPTKQETTKHSQNKRRKKKKVDIFEDECGSILVIDAGSYLMRAGFCGDSSPRGVFQPMVGRPKQPSVMVGMSEKDSYVGDEALAKRGMLSLTHTIENGIIVNWDNIEKVLHHTFYNEMRVSPDEHPVFLSESPINPKENREKTLQLMFETFDIPKLYLANTSFCVCVASGRNTACVLESGYETTNAVPIYEGNVLKNAITSMNIGGNHVTNYLQNLLSEKGYRFTTTAEKAMVLDMKEKLGCVALDYADGLQRAEMSGRLSRSYELPDGQVIGDEATKISRFKCAECLFDPSMIGDKSVGMNNLLCEAIRGSGEYMMDMCANVVLSGGNTMLDGFEDRIHKDLTAVMNANDERVTNGYIRENNEQTIANDIMSLVYEYSPTELKVKVIAPPERKYSVWIGGSVLSSLSSMKEMFISKEDYDTHGVNILDQKCLH